MSALSLSFSRGQVVFDLEWKSTGQNKTEVSPPPRPPVNSRVFEASEENIVHGLVALGIGGVIAVPTDTLYGQPLPLLHTSLNSFQQSTDLHDTASTKCVHVTVRQGSYLPQLHSLNLSTQ